ncbi:MAG: amino acid ABC transporter permease [Pseudomonadota bacterium]
MAGYHWHWGVFLDQVPSGETYYWVWLLEGLQWTVAVSLSGWVMALLCGGLVGVFRTVPGRWLSRLAGVYVECFRNIPLLVQLFLWYFVMPEWLPTPWGDAIKQWHPLTQQFLAAWLCLGFFTSARVAEQVRAGIESLPAGQRAAALALGLTLPQTYRQVLLPQVARIILPPLTSEFLGIFKNSAVANTIGLMELSRQAQQLADYTAQPYEAFIAVTLLYLLVNGLVMLIMRRIETSTRLSGSARGGHD